MRGSFDASGLGSRRIWVTKEAIVKGSSRAFGRRGGDILERG